MQELIAVLEADAEASAAAEKSYRNNRLSKMEAKKGCSRLTSRA